MPDFAKDVIKSLCSYYESEGIRPDDGFHCKYQEFCNGDLARGMQCHVGGKYGSRLRVLVASLDCGGGGASFIKDRTADVVIIALPGTKETAGMFDAEKIRQMKKSAVLVNVGRGFIVNTHDLTNALQNGALSGAVLDVTDPEPLPADHPLRRMENVVLTPHVSGTTWGENQFTRRRIIDIFCENLRLDSKNETKKNVVDFSRGY